MRNPLGLRGSLAVSFVALALVLLWLNHTTASDLRSYVIKQREIEKARTVALILEPMIRHESEWVQSVSRMLQHDLANALSSPDDKRTEAVGELLDRTFQHARVDVLEVTDEQGIVIYRAQEPQRRGDPATYWGIDEALSGNATLVSIMEKNGPLITYVEPIRIGDSVVGAASTGKRIDDEFVKALSREIGAELFLVSRTGEVAASSKPRGTAPDAAAIKEAFQHKDAAFRSIEGSRLTQAYLPIFIIDDGWVLIAEIDSSPAYRAISESNGKAALNTLGSIAVAVVVTLLLLRINLIPLRRLRRKAERLVADEAGEVVADPGGDDIESVVRSLNDLTDILIARNRLLDEQRAGLKISSVAFESQQAMAITNADFEVLTVNKAFTDSTGFGGDETIGRTLAILRPDLFDSDSRDGFLESTRNSGEWQGELRNRRKNGETYPVWLNVSAVKDDHGVVTHFVASLTDLTKTRKTEQKIRELAFVDPTTRLPNRRLLIDRLRQTVASCSRTGTCGAVLLIDIDDFKTLNSVLGHDNGDRLLQLVGQRLTRCIREAETIARLGGDEFVVLLNGLSSNPHDAALQAEAAGARVLDAFAPVFRIVDTEYRCTASIGAALICGREASVDGLLQQADLALYKAKDTGRNCLRFYDPEMQTRVMERATLEGNLRLAIERSQLVLHYQPQVQADGRISGAEALVRWSHPERGMVSPAAFIPLAEETGLILPLGQWVLDTVCATLAEWANQPELAGLTIAVNVSARQFHHPDFVDHVFSTLARTRANPERLKLELTESLLVENVQEVIERMRALKARGISFSLDDFGTGYSSLSYLKQLPLEQLKIDQSFVRDILVDPNDAAIATTIIALAESLGLQVIAEGVETADQRDFLAHAGCLAYQGYFFGRPLPVQEFENRVRSIKAAQPCFVGEQ